MNKSLVLTLVLLFCSSPTFSIHKCTINGKTTYTDLPCPEDAQKTPFTQQVIPPTDPAAAERQHLANQKKLHQLQHQKAKQEKQQQREDQTIARQIKKDEAHQLKCNELDLKRKSARRDQFDVQLEGKRRTIEKARMRAKQAENRYMHYCKS
jgi:hypothetical protein